MQHIINHCMLHFKPPLPFSNQSHLPVTRFVEKQNNKPPEAEVPRVVQFTADFSGCGLYRMGWMSHLMNYQAKLAVSDMFVMVGDANWYRNVKAIRLQRQATTDQKKFVQFLKQIQPEIGFKLIYEVDDVVFAEDIPDFNKFKSAFTSDEIRNNVIDIINMCDEVSVTCDFMRDLYTQRTGKKEISVIPNFPAKFWIGNYFDPNKINRDYDANKKKPRILYSGSGAHFDVENKVNQKDDFEHVIKAIIDSRHKFQWIFIGAFPLQLQQYIQNKDIEFHPWCRLYDFPKKIYDLNVQMMVAPLQDNNFNKSKSDIKYIEACAFGLPVACQDMCTYQNAEIKFRTGEEMIAKIEEEVFRAGHYKNSYHRRRKVAEDRFLELEKNLDCYYELFMTPYGSPNRKNMKRYNP